MKTPNRSKFQSPSHARAPQQEKELARRANGCVTRGSGSGNEKGDVRVRGVCRIEAKTTKHKSFSVTLGMVEKIEAAALPHGEMPVIVVEFISEGGEKLHELAVCPVYVIEGLTDGLDR